MSDSRKPRWRSYQARVAFRSGELRTTCESRTGMDSFSSILRCRRDLDVGGDLDGAAVDVEEAEAVAAAGGVDLARLGDQLHSAREELLGERVHVGGVRGAVGDEVEALLLGLAEPDDVLLGGALGGQEGDAGVLGDLGQAPDAGVEVELLVVVGHGQVDVPQVGEQTVASWSGPSFR